MAAVAEPLQTSWLATLLTVGVGFTVMVKLMGVPVQVTPESEFEGVTVIVAVTGVVPLLIAVNGLIFPVPSAFRPMDGLELVQL